MDSRSFVEMAFRVAGMPKEVDTPENSVRVNTDPYAATAELSRMMQEALAGLQIVAQAMFDGDISEKAFTDVSNSIVSVALDGQRGMVVINRTIENLERSISVSKRYRRKCLHTK